MRSRPARVRIGLRAVARLRPDLAWGRSLPRRSGPLPGPYCQGEPEECTPRPLWTGAISFGLRGGRAAGGDRQGLRDQRGPGDDAEIERAVQLTDTMAMDDISGFRDQYRDALERLIEAKSEGKELREPAEGEERESGKVRSAARPDRARARSWSACRRLPPCSPLPAACRPRPRSVGEVTPAPRRQAGLLRHLVWQRLVPDLAAARGD